MKRPALPFGLLLLVASIPARPLDLHQLQIDDMGKVLPSFRQHHAKKGDKISWVRQTGASQTWYIKFTNDSPCAEGKEFGERRLIACTVSAACRKAGDPACKSYHYRSATDRGSQMNDPEILVDP